MQWQESEVKMRIMLVNMMIFLDVFALDVLWLLVVCSNVIYFNPRTKNHYDLRSVDTESFESTLASSSSEQITTKLMKQTWRILRENKVRDEDMRLCRSLATNQMIQWFREYLSWWFELWMVEFEVFSFVGVVTFIARISWYTRSWWSGVEFVV